MVSHSPRAGTSAHGRGRIHSGASLRASCYRDAPPASCVLHGTSRPGKLEAKPRLPARDQPALRYTFVTFSA